jgi:hypothetical protein
MQQHEGTARTAPPKLPWYGTVIVLIMVLVVALVKPFAPHGIVEYAHRLVGRPLSLDIGHGKSVRLIEESAIKTGCQAMDLNWNSDGSVLVVKCLLGLQAWTREGRLIGNVPISTGWPVLPMQVLADPFHVVYLSKAGDGRSNEAALMSWDVQHGKTAAEPIPSSAMGNFAIDQYQRRVAIVDASTADRDIKMLSLDDGRLMRAIHVQSGTHSLRWTPTKNALLLGSYDGVLRLADATTGDVQELATPYAIKFPGGGGADGIV